jgi:hypothetical protein
MYEFESVAISFPFPSEKQFECEDSGNETCSEGYVTDVRIQEPRDVKCK